MALVYKNRSLNQATEPILKHWSKRPGLQKCWIPATPTDSRNVLSTLLANQAQIRTLTEAINQPSLKPETVHQGKQEVEKN